MSVISLDLDFSMLVQKIVVSSITVAGYKTYCLIIIHLKG